jgi:hypothetical protein
MVALFVAAIAYIYPILWDALYDVSLNQSDSSIDALNTLNPVEVVNWLDVMLVCGFFAVNILVCIILPMYIEHNPIYYAAIFGFGFIWIYFVAIWSNVMTDTLESLGTLNLVKFIVSNGVIIEVVFLLLLAMVMFYKRRGEAIQ